MNKQTNTSVSRNPDNVTFALECPDDLQFLFRGCSCKDDFVILNGKLSAGGEADIGMDTYSQSLMPLCFRPV